MLYCLDEILSIFNYLVNSPKSSGLTIFNMKYPIKRSNKTILEAILVLPIKSLIFLIPYMIYRIKEIEIKYPPNNKPINVYYPRALSKTFTTFSLFFITVLDRINAIREIKRGMRIIATVKLKLLLKAENIPIPLARIGAKES